MIFWIAGFATIGTPALFLTHAASPEISIEAENGTVTAPASVFTDAIASSTQGSEQVVKFGTAAAVINIGLDTTCKFYSVTNVQQAFCDGFNTATAFVPVIHVPTIKMA